MAEVMNSIQRRMVGHGAVIMLLGLAAGFGLAIELVGGFEYFPGRQWAMELPSDSSAWARTHVGGLLNGLMIFAGALLLWGMAAPDRLCRQIAWMLVGAGYANTIFYWAGMFAPGRALTFGDNRIGEASVAGVIGFAPALVFALVTMVAMVILAKFAFASAKADP